ncbi:hypothetical protein PSPO01_01996 [Paraphaeosphaeria sporulosa]
MQFSKTLVAAVLALTPLAASYCVEVYGEAHSGLGSTEWMNVKVNDALICSTEIFEGGGHHLVDCGDGGSAGGTLEFEVTALAGPWDATYCDEKGRCTTVTFEGPGWNCNYTNCCGGNIPCQCADCGGFGKTCVDD